jgi:hypothetical protein
MRFAIRLGGFSLTSVDTSADIRREVIKATRLEQQIAVLMPNWHFDHAGGRDTSSATDATDRSIVIVYVGGLTRLVPIVQ